jgi:hypothetical protein
VAPAVPSGQVTQALSARLLWTWFLLVGLSQLADLATTWLSLAVGLRENNPLVAATLAGGHFPLYGLVKLGLVTVLGVAILSGRSEALAGARVVVAIFVAVALANLGAVLGL